MINIKEMVMQIVETVDAPNKEYIMEDRRIEREIESAKRFAEEGDQKIVNHIMEDIKKKVSAFDGKYIVPSNAKEGQGVTMHLYSDAHAGTVVKVTKSTVTVQRDKATIDTSFRPDFTPGGFAGHASNNDEQAYTYERDEQGETIVFRWSKKHKCYIHTSSGRKLTKGRREFYDYNF